MTVDQTLILKRPASRFVLVAVSFAVDFGGGLARGLARAGGVGVVDEPNDGPP